MARHSMNNRKYAEKNGERYVLVREEDLPQEKSGTVAFIKGVLALSVMAGLGWFFYSLDYARLFLEVRMTIADLGHTGLLLGVLGAVITGCTPQKKGFVTCLGIIVISAMMASLKV